MTKRQAIWAAIKGGGWLSVLTTLLGIGVTVGILTADQDQALLAVATGALNLVQLIQTAVHLVQASKLTLSRNAFARRLAVAPERIP
jgi:hypothetical protein